MQCLLTRLVRRRQTFSTWHPANATSGDRQPHGTSTRPSSLSRRVTSGPSRPPIRRASRPVSPRASPARPAQGANPTGLFETLHVQIEHSLYIPLPKCPTQRPVFTAFLTRTRCSSQWRHRQTRIQIQLILNVLVTAETSLDVRCVCYSTQKTKSPSCVEQLASFWGLRTRPHWPQAFGLRLAPPTGCRTASKSMAFDTLYLVHDVRCICCGIISESPNVCGNRASRP